MTLAELNSQERCRIIAAGAQDSEIQSRLYALGLYPGIEVEVLRLAPAGDPIQVRAGSMLLSIRKSEASVIEIESTP